MTGSTKKTTVPLMKPQGLPQNPGQAMFPNDQPDGFMHILGQAFYKRKECTVVKLTLDPPPLKFEVSEDDVRMTVINWIRKEKYPCADLDLLIIRSGKKGQSFTISVPAEVAQVTGLHYPSSPYSPQHSP